MDQNQKNLNMKMIDTILSIGKMYSELQSIKYIWKIICF